MKTSLDNIRQSMANKVADALSEIRYMTSANKKEYIEKLQNGINGKLLITSIRPQEGRTNSDDYNQTAYELYIDILTTFGYIDELYDVLSSHGALNESIINTLKSTIMSLHDRLEECKNIIGTAGSPECYIEGFRTQNNQEWEERFYTERYGEVMPLSTWARFNPDQENITLNYTRQQNAVMYRSGVQLGEVVLSKQYGAGFISARNPECKLNNMLNNNPSLYWSETIYADNELEIKGMGYGDAEGNIGYINRSFYDIPRGALCEVCIIFEAMAKVNEIILKPFGSFPIDIVAIRYQLTDDEDDDTYDIVSPDNDKEWLVSRTINQEYAFHFNEINCKRLYILINQLHFIKDSYMISCNQMFKNELWFNSVWDTTQDAIMENTTVFQPCYLDRAVEDPVWKYINNKLITNKKLSINDMLINNADKYIPVTKYKYTYGFYKVAPCFSEFQRAGIWVSSEIPVDGPIDTISITTEEEHFKTSDGYIATDIEFYITTKDNPEYTNWIPICPKNKKYIYKELLQLDYDYCYLRHLAVCGNTVVYDKDGNQSMEQERPIVYMNDIVMTEDADYILRYDKNGNVKAIEIANIDKFAMYTVSYMPIDAAKEISLIDGDVTPNITFQEIMGDGTACYELEDYPYYMQDGKKIQSWLKLIDIDSNQVLSQTNLDNSPIVCVTNVTNPADSYKNFVAKSNKIQYYTYGKHIYFSRPLTPNQKFEINYPALSSKIRIKAILRRNTKRDLWLTPVLQKLKVEFTTL